MLDIRQDPLTSPEIRALLAFHQQSDMAVSHPGTSTALNLSALQTPDITVWSVWDGDALAGCGALKQLSSTHGELKSMRTHPDHLRKGVAQTLLAHLIGEARVRGYARLSLDTGTGEAFEPALALYRKNGFVNGPVFGDYTPSAFNQFLHLAFVTSE